ncbi:hypothetical protein L1887_21853 [Cichorium endivia]|nr:hypothetical protein L1887_21853 [Cichorium endivia]
MEIIFTAGSEKNQKEGVDIGKQKLNRRLGPSSSAIRPLPELTKQPHEQRKTPKYRAGCMNLDIGERVSDSMDVFPVLRIFNGS